MTTEPSKKELYSQAIVEIRSLIADLRDPIAAMASVCAVIHERLPYASWTGFYRVAGPELLRVGPYQGPVGCLEISFGSGVCGAAAAEGRTQLVPDVHAFPGHIACDPKSRSEIVVPVFDANKRLVAVLDLDSHAPGAFDTVDAAALESIAELLSLAVTEHGNASSVE